MIEASRPELDRTGGSPLVTRSTNDKSRLMTNDASHRAKRIGRSLLNRKSKVCVIMLDDAEEYVDLHVSVELRVRAREPTSCI